MAEKIDIEVNLKSGLQQVVDATKGLKLDKGQSERLEKYHKGAQLALDSGDLKAFQKNFNNLINLFKDAAAATGEVSKSIKNLTDQQSKLNQEINRLKDKKTNLESKLTKDGSRITAKTAKELASTSSDAKKVITSSGVVATRNEIVELQQALNKFLQETGKTINQVTNEDLKNVRTASGITFGSRNAMFAANRYVQAEAKYEKDIQTELKDTTDQITVEENNFAQLDAEIKRMNESAALGAEGINKLYAEILKLSNLVNTDVTEKINKEKLDKTDRDAASDRGLDLDPTSKSKNGLGKAFKQFTLYAVAVRAAKQALREAVQTVRELDKYLTEQAMVTGKTRKETYALVGQYQELALACGATTKEIAQVTTEYMKQGKSTADALVLTEAAVKAAKVARVSVGDSVNYLTTALNGFRLEAEDAMRVSDIFAAVAASSATDYDELAIALSKVASQANLAGMSIEYTTALLTKGLETTREAPETMGTALKTIIARMREMSDYGETLEGDTDINNVESQLAYVGIALKNEQGELRSTEEVLDELGKKWDQLNKNQQAALAKALAGTRQQSRLIAMMDDYERVIELQQIAERSTGATSAQAAVYLEGMEAAMNKIQVAWEKIVMTITDSKVIIGFFEWIANVLNNIAEFLSTDFGMVTALVTAATIGMTILSIKLKEYEMQKQTNRLKLEEQKIELQKQKAAKETRLEQIKSRKEALLKTQVERAELKLLFQQAKVKAQANGNAALVLAMEKDILALEAEEKEDQQELVALAAEETLLKAEIRQIDADCATLTMQQAQNGAGLLSVLTSITPVLSFIIGLMQVWSAIQSIIIAKKKQSALATKAETKEEIKKATASAGGMFANIVSSFKDGGIPGIIAGIALATAVVAGLCAFIGVAALGISAAVSSGGKSGAEKTSEEINKLSGEIYKLNEAANAINNVTSQFDKLDNKVIKTKEDIKEMSSLIDSAGDKLSAENKKNGKGEEIEGTSDQAIYKNLQTETEKRKFLDVKEREYRAKANQYRQQQLAMVNNSEYKNIILDDSTTNSSYLETQSAIRAIANNEVYETVDALKAEGVYTEEQLRNTEDLTEAIFAEVSALEALDYANDPQKIRNLVSSLNDLTSTQIFLDETKSLTERIQAYKEIEEALNGDAAALEAFNKAYSEWETFSTMSEDVLEFIEVTELSIDQINKLYEGYTALQKAGMKITKKEFHAALEDTMTLMNDDLSNFEQVIKSTYGYLLEGLDPFKKEYQDKWNTIVSAIGDIFAVGLLDMGQNMEKFGNTINSFYEKASQWGSMSESDKMSFISDNAEMFSGEGGAKMLEAFQSGNYDVIEAALETQMKAQTDQRLEEVRRTLAVEEARVGEDRNEAYIQALKDYEKYLTDGNDLYKASLELRLEQEKKQIDEYKSYLEDQQKALEDSLNKRKDAYEKYFESVNQDSEYEDYKDQADLLTTNISKLASSSNADAKNKTADLEQQLKELEKERLETLRERAQEEVIQNIDDQVEAINDKFDKLLNSNEALLAAMTGELNNPNEFLANLLSNKLDSGATTLEMQSYLEELKAIYGNTLGTDVFDNIKVTENNGQTVLNINNQEILLSEGEQQSVYAAIIAALRQIGKA